MRNFAGYHASSITYHHRVATGLINCDISLREHRAMFARHIQAIEPPLVAKRTQAIGNHSEENARVGRCSHASWLLNDDRQIGRYQCKCSLYARSPCYLNPISSSWSGGQT